MRSNAERNLVLFQWFAPLYNCHFWVAIWFLFFNQTLSVADVLLLESIYYVVVVALEVPSGYLSDRWGRVPTLRLSALASLASVGVLAFADPGFLNFAVAQALWAISYACYSGTDAAFHFDTLEAAGREHEFEARQARLNRNLLIARGVGALGGGLLAMGELVHAYYASFAVAVLFTGIAFALEEVGTSRPPAILGQVAMCLGHLRSPLMAWLFYYAVLQTVLVHIPYEFAQPWLALLFGEGNANLTHTPWVSGVLIAVIAWLGAIAAGYSIDLRRRFGLGGTLIAITMLQVLLIAAMAYALHPMVVLLIAFRGLQSAIGQVLVTAEVTPRVGRAQRATYLSIQSSVGRLAFAATLWGLAWIAADASQTEAIATTLESSLVLALAGLVVLIATRRRAQS